MIMTTTATVIPATAAMPTTTPTATPAITAVERPLALVVTFAVGLDTGVAVAYVTLEVWIRCTDVASWRLIVVRGILVASSVESTYIMAVLVSIPLPVKELAF